MTRKALEADRKRKEQGTEEVEQARAREIAAQHAAQRQRESEEARVEERAQEMAAQMIQAQVRGNMVRKAFASRTLP